MNAKNKISVICALMPGDAAKKRIEDFIVNRLKGSAKDIVYTADSSLLGGIIIKKGDTVFDGSIKRLLEKAKE